MDGQTKMSVGIDGDMHSRLLRKRNEVRLRSAGMTHNTVTGSRITGFSESREGRVRVKGMHRLQVIVGYRFQASARFCHFVLRSRVRLVRIGSFSTEKVRRDSIYTSQCAGLRNTGSA